MTNPASKFNIDQPNMEQVLRDALKSILKEDGRPDPKTSFYHKFKEEVAEHDEDFYQKYDGDLNTTLVFTGLFSAIVSAFIIDIQSELSPDYGQLNNGLLELLLNVTVGNIPPGQAISLPRWTGPDPGIRQVQAILYATLCTTLFAAFLATLGKQWLNRYRQTDAHGPIEDRCRDRERKLSGIDKWRFHLVMQSAPLMIQGSLGLFGAALSKYLWGVDHVSSSVVIGVTTFGFLLSMIIVAISVRYFDCPFQTPLSSFIRFILRKVKTWRKKAKTQVATNLAGLAGDGGVTASVAPLQALHRQVFYSSLSPFWEKGYRFDAHCITRMLKMSTNADTIRLTMDFVQEIVWDTQIKTVPLGWIYRKLMNCFDFTHHRTPILISALRDVAYLSAKALVHIQVQRRVSQYGRLGPVGDIWQPDATHTRLGYTDSRIDPDLGSALLMVDMALGLQVKIPWDEYRLSPAHHLWASHLFVYYTLHEPLSDNVLAFVKYSLDPEKPPSDAVIADCLYIINIILGACFHVEDFTRRDKSRHINDMIHRIFLNLSRRFRGPTPLANADASKRTFRALGLIARLRMNAVATRGYELFKTIMEPAVAVAPEEKMKAARLALHAAYPPGLESVPPVQDPPLILVFLRYHINPNVEMEDRAHAIASAIRAIRSTSDGPLSQSWTWCVDNAGEILTGLQQSPDSEEFKWWHKILWRYHGKLDLSTRGRVDDIAKNGGDGIDLKGCKIAVEEEIDKVKGSGGPSHTLKNLEDACARLTELINDREKSQPPVVPFI